MKKPKYLYHGSQHKLNIIMPQTDILAKIGIASIAKIEAIEERILCNE